MKKSTYSGKIAGVVCSFLEGVKLEFTFDDRCGEFKFGLGMKGKVSKVTYIINVGEKEYTVYIVSSVCPNTNNRKTMHNLMEFLCRANYGMINSNFELDVTSGEIRMKYFVDCEGTEPTAGLVKKSICLSGLMFEHYGDGIADIILDNAAAKAAFDRCKSTPIEEDRLKFDEPDEEDWEDMEDSEEVQRMFDELEKRLGDSRDMAPKKTAWDTELPRHIKIDLFATEGGAD